MVNLLEQADMISQAKSLVEQNKAVVAHIHGTYAIITIFSDLPNTITSQQFAQLMDLTDFCPGILQSDIDNWKIVIPCDIELSRTNKQKVINCLNNWNKFNEDTRRLYIFTYKQWIQHQQNWLVDANDFED